jgi:Aminotransferase class I and II
MAYPNNRPDIDYHGNFTSALALRTERRHRRHGRDRDQNGHRPPEEPAISPATIIRYWNSSASSSTWTEEAALIFTSRYISNETDIWTLRAVNAELPHPVRRAQSQFRDRRIRHPHCEKQIFRHNDMAHLEQLLPIADRLRPKLIIFESFNSMDGDVARMAQICGLAARYGAMT